MPETPADQSTGATSEAPQARPRTLVVAAALMIVEAIAAAVMGVLEAVNVNLNRPVVGIGGAIILIGYAVALVLLARGVFRGRSWSRGPSVAVQVLHLPVAYSFLGPVTWPVSVLLGGVSLVVLVCLVLPSSTRVLVRDL